MSSPAPARRNDFQSFTREYAESLDAHDPLKGFQSEFIIPTKKDLARKTIVAAEDGMYGFCYMAGLATCFHSNADSTAFIQS